ncbi:hypothetical protein JCM8097_001630 [Rhodosporidiobolus ruineniae]
MRSSRSSTTSLFGQSNDASAFSPSIPYSSPLTDLDDYDSGAFNPRQHLPSSFSPALSQSSHRLSHSPSPTPHSHARSTAPQTSASKPRKERQTRLQEHLRTVKSSRGISPASAAKPRSSASASSSTSAQKTVPAAAAAVESVAAGRTRRKAATKVVVQDLGFSSDEEQEEDGDVSDAALEPEEEETPKTRRVGRRAAPTPKRVASVEDLAPAVKPESSRSARKSPTKQQQQQQLQAVKQLRQREISNVSIDVDGMDDLEVQHRLGKETEELMGRLAQHGINPAPDVLNRALRSMTDGNEKLTVDWFLRTLSSLNAYNSPLGRSAIPLPLPPAPLALQVSPPSQPKKVSFSTLESPSTPSTAEHPVFNFPSPPRPTYPAGATHLPVPPTQPGLLPSPPGFGGSLDAFAAQQQQQQQHYPNPASVRANRLAAFSNRSHSAPVVPQVVPPQQQQTRTAPVPMMQHVAGLVPGHARQQPLPHPQVGAKGLVATSVHGMGRVAVSRRTLFGAPAAATSPLPSPVRENAPALLPAFGFPAPPTAAAAPRPAPPAASNRLSKLQSWLDDDEDDEEPAPAASASKEGALDAAAAISLKAKAAAAAAPAPSPIKLVDAPPSDSEDVEIRVGGKSVQILRSSTKKRQLDSVVDEPAKPVERAVTRSAKSKGKQRVAAECLCGMKAGEQVEGEEIEVDAETACCAECDVVFHLACLNVSSARLLPASWACERCSGVDAATAARQTTPPPLLSVKRVRIGTTTTPIVLGQEPTFALSSTMSPAPRRNNDFSDCADMALAPSPMHSPVRAAATIPSSASHHSHHLERVPSSPTPSKVAIPVTPQFGSATLHGASAPGDYSPHSPLSYRQKRARVASNGGFDFLNPAAGWADAPSAFEAALSAGDDYHSHHAHLPAWADVTMTPSRALSSGHAHSTPATAGTSASATATASALWDSPFGGGHARRSSFGFASVGGGAHLRTPSTDFLSSLDTAHHLPHSAPAHSSRIFAHSGEEPGYSFGAVSGQQQTLTGSPSLRPTSPLNPRRVLSGTGAAVGSMTAPNHHRRTSSTLGRGVGLANPWSPTPGHASIPNTFSSFGAHERRPSGGGSARMQVTQSMPGLRSAGMGVVGFDGRVIEDLAF